MINRTEKNQKNKKFKRNRLVVSALLLMLGLGTSVNVAFANEDINAMLTSWFDQKTNESISEIETAINDEKAKSMKRLKQELQSEMKSAEKNLDAFTEQEKQKRVNELKNYTNQLISDISSAKQSEQENVKNEIDAIVQEAVNKIDNIEASIETVENNEVINDEPTEQTVDRNTNQQEEESSK